MPSDFFKSLFLNVSYIFSPILTKLGTRDLGANTQKTVEKVFEILILTFWRIF